MNEDDDIIAETTDTYRVEGSNRQFASRSTWREEQSRPREEPSNNELTWSHLQDMVSRGQKDIEKMYTPKGGVDSLSQCTDPASIDEMVTAIESRRRPPRRLSLKDPISIDRDSLPDHVTGDVTERRRTTGREHKTDKHTRVGTSRRSMETDGWVKETQRPEVEIRRDGSDRRSGESDRQSEGRPGSKEGPRERFKDENKRVDRSYAAASQDDCVSISSDSVRVVFSDEDESPRPRRESERKQEHTRDTRISERERKASEKEEGRRKSGWDRMPKRVLADRFVSDQKTHARAKSGRVVHDILESSASSRSDGLREHVLAGRQRPDFVRAPPTLRASSPSRQPRAPSPNWKTQYKRALQMAKKDADKLSYLAYLSVKFKNIEKAYYDTFKKPLPSFYQCMHTLYRCMHTHSCTHSVCGQIWTRKTSWTFCQT